MPQSACRHRKPRRWFESSVRPSIAPKITTHDALILAVLGAALFRAGIMPRVASALFAVGLLVVRVVVSLLPFDLHRVAAVPIGVASHGSDTRCGLNLASEARRV
jgi:hypothetical protein